MAAPAGVDNRPVTPPNVVDITLTPPRKPPKAESEAASTDRTVSSSEEGEGEGEGEGSGSVKAASDSGSSSSARTTINYEFAWTSLAQDLPKGPVTPEDLRKILRSQNGQAVYQRALSELKKRFIRLGAEVDPNILYTERNEFVTLQESAQKAQDEALTKVWHFMIHQIPNIEAEVFSELSDMEPAAIREWLLIPENCERLAPITWSDVNHLGITIFLPEIAKLTAIHDNDINESAISKADDTIHEDHSEVGEDPESAQLPKDKTEVNDGTPGPSNSNNQDNDIPSPVPKTEVRPPANPRRWGVIALSALAAGLSIGTAYFMRNRNDEQSN